jgi:site-specific DNA-methyltransferase (adenine-specific)
VRTYSNEGDVVLDNAFGSGSFLVAAAMEKRRFIGIELVPRYVALARTAVEQALAAQSAAA